MHRLRACHPRRPVADVPALQVATLCVGQACSMGSLLLAGGAPGMRRSLPNSRVMIHQPSGGFQGQVWILVVISRHRHTTQG